LAKLTSSYRRATLTHFFGGGNSKQLSPKNIPTFGRIRPRSLFIKREREHNIELLVYSVGMRETGCSLFHMMHSFYSVQMPKQLVCTQTQTPHEMNLFHVGSFP